MHHADPRLRDRKGGGAPSTRAGILLQPVERTMVEQVAPLQPMEDTTDSSASLTFPWLTATHEEL